MATSVATILSITNWESAPRRGEGTTSSDQRGEVTTPSDPRTDAKAFGVFAGRVQHMDTKNLLLFRSQCNSGDFSGSVISVIERQLLSLAKNQEEHKDIRDAMADSKISGDPNLSVLIAKINSLMRLTNQNKRTWSVLLKDFAHEFCKNCPMDKMTSGTACLLSGITLAFLGWQNLANGKLTKNPSLETDGAFQITLGISAASAPVVNALYYVWLGDRS